MTDRRFPQAAFLALLLFLPVGAGAATLSGKVRDAQGGPASNVTVFVGDKFEFTDVNGRYRIREVPAGTQKIQVKRGASILKEETIEIAEPGTKKDLMVP